MPRDSQGNTSPLPGTIVATGDTILPSQHNPALVDLYAMMTQSLSRDGQGGMRAALNMNGYPIRNIGAATQPNDAVALSQFQNGMPLGAVVDFAGVTAPNTWMLCFGQAIEVSAYPEFVAACYVGNALNATAGFGYRTTSQTNPSANRSTSGQYIVLPDLRGRVGAGKDDMGGGDAKRLSFFGAPSKIIGSGIGSASHALTTGELARHSHSLDGVASGGAHSHPVIYAGPTGSGGSFRPTGDGGRLVGFPFSPDTIPSDSGTHTHTITGTAVDTGLNEPHNNTQPTLIMNKIIKVSY